MYGQRVCIPRKFRKNVLEELHAGHLGIVKMKAIARSFVYWKNIDNDIEEAAKNCVDCARYKADPPKSKVHYWEYPSMPWERIHVDFAGPIFEHTFFLIVDAHSKWLEVYPMKVPQQKKPSNVFEIVLQDSDYLGHVILKRDIRTRIDLLLPELKTKIQDKLRRDNFEFRDRKFDVGDGVAHAETAEDISKDRNKELGSSSVQGVPSTDVAVPDLSQSSAKETDSETRSPPVPDRPFPRRSGRIRRPPERLVL
ncbi:uncharacterized protein K02A2.6 [Trichonephila clavipes]|nr:uncharacterized protein K02A2.6 [Trichonephila clavipes]